MESKCVLQRARGFARVEDGEIDQLSEPFRLDGLSGREEGCHVGSGERIMQLPLLMSSRPSCLRDQKVSDKYVLDIYEKHMNVYNCFVHRNHPMSMTRSLALSHRRVAY